MTEFVDLNNIEQDINIPQTVMLDVVLPDIDTLEIPTVKIKSTEYLENPESELISYIALEGENSVEPECDETCNDCDVANAYGETYLDGSFKRENLFSELTSDYERSIIRQNLGIGDSTGIMTWGNISGNLANQVDLYDYIQTYSLSKINAFIAEVNGKLLNWSYDIKEKVDAKANNDSPNLTGEPTTTRPEISDSSNRIPTTEWVIDKINENSVGSLNWVRLSQDFMYAGDSPVNLIISWDYNEPIEQQSINGVIIPLANRAYYINGLNATSTFTLSYIVGGQSYSRSLTFDKILPIYYGTNSTYTQDIKTKDKEFVIETSNTKYGYVFYPSISIKRIAVDNIVGGFDILGTTTLNNIQYTIYKTHNVGLGTLNIKIL